MLINDVSLLRLDPRVFLDAAGQADVIIDGADGVVSGTTLSSAGSDFAARGVDAGHVVVVSNVPVEVEDRTGATTLSVSRPRADDAASLLPPPPGTGLSFSVRTFARLIALERAWALGALGLEPPAIDDEIDENAILDPAPIERLIAQRVVHRAYARAAAANPADPAIALAAAEHRRLAMLAAQQARAVLDLDGDGVPDATRRISVVTLTRG